MNPGRESKQDLRTLIWRPEASGGEEAVDAALYAAYIDMDNT